MRWTTQTAALPFFVGTSRSRPIHDHCNRHHHMQVPRKCHALPPSKRIQTHRCKCRDTWDALMSPAAMTTAKLCISQNHQRQSKKQPSLRHVLDVCTVLHSFGALGTHTHNNSRLSFHLIQGIVWEFANSPPTPASISIFSGDLRARTLRILAGLCMAPKLSDDDT